MLRWFAVQSKASRESEAERRIQDQGWRTALPLCSYERKRSRRIEMIVAPMFRRYLFVEFDIGEAGWQAIAHTKHVSGMLPEYGEPEPVRCGVIEEIMAAAAAAGGAIPLEKPKIIPFRDGEKVHFTEGAWLGVAAIVRLDEGERVRVLLDLFGRPRVIPVKRESIARG